MKNRKRKCKMIIQHESISRYHYKTQIIWKTEMKVSNNDLLITHKSLSSKSISISIQYPWNPRMRIWHEKENNRILFTKL